MFKQFIHDVHSQNGEDGIIGNILTRLPTSTLTKWAVEFGTLDGKIYSNTLNLVKQGWHSVMIEGDPAQTEALHNTAKEFPTIIPIIAFVARTAEEENSLFNLLKTTDVPEDFDVLSIDIDTYDSDVWESFVGYNPKIVVIEINSGTPVGVHHRHVEGVIPGGTSFSEMLNVGTNKGYTLVCHTGNCIFVRNDLISHLGMPQNLLDNPNSLFKGP